MTECPWQERVSAAADGELDEPSSRAAIAHAGRCSPCNAMLSATSALTEGVAVTRQWIKGDELSPGERRWLDGRWTRRLLGVAAVVIVVLSVPTFIRGDGISAESHAVRHIASWQIGFGVGLFVAAWMSRMSQAILALAATFAALSVTATALDLISGHRGPRIQSVHLVELVAVFLLWRLTPPHLLRWRRTKQ